MSLAGGFAYISYQQALKDKDSKRLRRIADEAKAEGDQETAAEIEAAIEGLRSG